MTLVRVVLPMPVIRDSEFHATVVDIDRFGNLELNVTGKHVDALGLSPGNKVERRFGLYPCYALVAEAYADAARCELFMYEDSSGAYAISGGNTAALTEASLGDEGRGHLV